MMHLVYRSQAAVCVSRHLTTEAELPLLMPMGMTKRLQIPVTEQECTYFQTAARRAGLPLSEWVRRHLWEKANKAAKSSPLSPRDALDLLRRLEAPIGDVNSMVEESLSERYS